MPDRNDVITFGELTRALEETGLYPKAWATETVPPDGYAKVAEKLFWTALKYRIEPVANHDDLTITKKELRQFFERVKGNSEMNILGFTSPGTLAEAAVRNARSLRTEESKTPEESITKDQLKNALNVAGHPGDTGYVIRPLTTPFLADSMTAEHAASAIWKAKDEPEYKTGDIVKDFFGHVYKRYGAGWLGFGTGGEVGFGVPRRPLKKVKVVEE